MAAQNGRDVRGDGRHMVWRRSSLIDEYIQNDKLLHAATLLEPIVFEYLAHKVEQYIEDHGGKLYYDAEARKSDPGNHSKLKIRYMVFISFFRKRTNIVPEAVGALFGMHRTTVERQCKFIDGVLEQVVPGTAAMRERLRNIETSEEFLEFTGGALMHDGTLTPARDTSDPDNPETSGFSGKHKMAGLNTVFSCGRNGLMLGMSQTVPGNWHDMKAFTTGNMLDLGLFQVNRAPDSEESAKVIRELPNYFDKGFTGIKKYAQHINAKVSHRVYSPVSSSPLIGGRG